jgi:hypothetical protein
VHVTLPATWRVLVLPSIRPWLLPASIVLWSLAAVPFAVYMAVASGRTWVLLAIAGAPAAMLLRRRPHLAGTALIVAATILRLSWIGASSSDPIEISQLAAGRAFAGQNPYDGFVYAFGQPYPYGPLGLLSNLGGIPLELIATIATSALLVWARAWMTLALFNAWPQFIYMAAIGNNDFSVGFVLVLALVVLRYRPRLGMVLLAAAIAIKPYAGAWAIPAAGYAGLVPAMIGGAASLLLWSPVLLIWGVPSYLRSVIVSDQLRSMEGSLYPSWAFGDVWLFRMLVVPFSLAGLWLRSWPAMALLGTAGFVAFLGFSGWAHAGYVAVVLPVIGLTLEWRPRDLPKTVSSAGRSAGRGPGWRRDRPRTSPPTQPVPR